jgi:pyruvate formate-lyase activating enzyme-like uncharacterized protein
MFTLTLFLTQGVPLDQTQKAVHYRKNLCPNKLATFKTVVVEKTETQAIENLKVQEMTILKYINLACHDLDEKNILELLKEGFHGVFFDYCEGPGITKKSSIHKRAQQLEQIVHLVQSIHKQFPHIKMFMNKNCKALASLSKDKVEGLALERC